MCPRLSQSNVYIATPTSEKTRIHPPLTRIRPSGTLGNQHMAIFPSWKSVLYTVRRIALARVSNNSRKRVATDRSCAYAEGASHTKSSFLILMNSEPIRARSRTTCSGDEHLQLELYVLGLQGHQVTPGSALNMLRCVASLRMCPSTGLVCSPKRCPKISF